MLVKIFVLIVLFAVVANLFTALFHMLRAERGHSRKALKFLTLRLALSIVLFASLYIMAKLGYIQPHGFPQQHAVAVIETPALSK
jgi:heme/copper-type cytochrome/quinol oxidase subunit 4